MKKLVNYEGDLSKVQKLLDITTWTHAFHKPYKADWREARIKAIDKLYKLRGEKYGQ